MGLWEPVTVLGGDTVPQDAAGSSEVIRVAKPQLPAELFTAS